MGAIDQAVGHLGDHETVVHLAAVDGGVGMAADDDVHPGKLLGDLHVGFIADVGKEDDHVAGVAQPLVLLDGLEDGLEAEALDVVRMGVRRHAVVDLNGTDKAHLDAVHVEDLRGAGIDAEFGCGIQVGTDVVEAGHVHQLAQTLGAGVEFMVAHGGGVEADHVHQDDHRVGRDLIDVVQRVAGAVVAGGEDEQRRVLRPQAVGDGRQLGEVLDLRVHVVAGEDVELLRLGQGGQREGEGRQGQCDSFHFSLNLYLMICPSLSGASRSIGCP